MTGTVSHEGTIFMMHAGLDNLRLDGFSMSQEEYKKAARTVTKYYPQFPNLASESVLESIQFEYTNWEDPENQTANLLAVDAIIGDHHFTCPSERLAKSYAAAGQDVYMFLLDEYFKNAWPEWMGTKHADEIFFVLGDPFFEDRSEIQRNREYTKDEKELSRLMMKYWSNFAKTG